ncbi:hypothetical protein [Nocardia abscessus]|uniref:hypothetical protein n=1 Tax=Nocardia abscessus TaxID=120957 RepID=UPI002458C44B|nr:hypothetical protein [Nocardia abscessus]
MGFWGTALSVGLPIVGNLILPGAGGLIGAAVGNIAAEAIDGNIDDWGDAFKAGALGAGGALLGGAVGGKLLSKIGAGTGGSPMSPNSWTKFADYKDGFKHNLGLFKGADRNGQYIGQTLGRGAGSWAAYKWNDSIPGLGIGNKPQGPGLMPTINIGNGPG